MSNKNLNYLIVDIGTGNVRVAISNNGGDLLAIERENVVYHKDENYKDALFFDPQQLWGQITKLCLKVIKQIPDHTFRAVTVSSQREGIVILDKEGNSLIGLPNHDHRGRAWENSFGNDKFIYNQTGRLPGSLFSACKIVGLREGRPEIYDEMSTFMSISDWAQYKFSGKLGYEHSQASETLVYNVAEKEWSRELCEIFGIDQKILPPLQSSGTILGNILPEIASELGVSENIKIIVGGSDTQLAIKSTEPSLNDIVIVSGTTTPVVKLTSEFVVDPKKRTWTNRHVEEDNFILETNTGVTGLNLQRLKEMFYPQDDYNVIEEEISKLSTSSCTASLGSLIATEKTPLIRGAFFFDAPISHTLCRADFMLAALWDIANSINENYQYLCKLTDYQRDYVWGCGGGFQSKILSQILADLMQKELRIRKGFQNASIIGAVNVCNDCFGIKSPLSDHEIMVYAPNAQNDMSSVMAWQNLRSHCKENLNN